jgi:hydroxyacylglutathione hydrolase
VLRHTVPAELWGTNCHVLATGPGADCVVVDPGYEVATAVRAWMRDHRLRPVAVLLTHGHVDHTWSVVPLCADAGIAAWIHPADRGQLADPASGLAPEVAAALAQMRTDFAEPDHVEDLVDGARLDLAGLALTVVHTPGHTAGSVMFDVVTAAYDSRDTGRRLVVTGDTLFAASIGRTDLPGGDPAAMERSLLDKVLPLPDDAIVLPGHGPETTIGTERATNPWLVDLTPGRLATE